MIALISSLTKIFIFFIIFINYCYKQLISANICCIIRLKSDVKIDVFKLLNRGTFINYEDSFWTFWSPFEDHEKKLI